MSVHRGRYRRPTVEDPAGKLARIKRVETLLVQADGELERMTPSPTLASLRHRATAVNRGAPQVC